MSRRKNEQFVHVWDPAKNRLSVTQLPEYTEDDLELFQRIVGGSVEPTRIGGMRCLVNESAKVDGQIWWATRFFGHDKLDIILGRIIFLTANEAKILKLGSGGYEVMQWSPKKTEETPFRLPDRTISERASGRH